VRRLLKIERYLDGQRTTIRLIDYIHSEHLGELKTLIQGSGPELVLDLDEVTLVDVDVVRFLNVCEAAGSTILHGPPYIREWKRWEQDRLG
jgi:hypothetical protein